MFQHINYAYSVISSMSRTINKLDQNDSHKRATIANVQASTPYTKHPIILHSISLSGIDTASSSSGGRKNLQLQMQGKELLCTLNYIFVNIL